MKRLTNNAPLTEFEAMNLSVTNLYERLKAYEDTGLEPEEVKKILDSLTSTIAGEIAEITGYADVARVSEIAKAEAEGRLLILPKTLYEADPTPLIMGVIEWKVTGVRYCDGTVRAYSVQTKNVQSIIYESEIGETVFFTREESEAALKGSVN